jgi:hypothetical protein
MKDLIIQPRGPIKRLATFQSIIKKVMIKPRIEDHLHPFSLSHETLHDRNPPLREVASNRWQAVDYARNRSTSASLSFVCKLGRLD